MRVAAYQCPLLPPGSMYAIDLIRRQVKVCESEGVTILCCPEAVLGGDLVVVKLHVVPHNQRRPRER